MDSGLLRASVHWIVRPLISGTKFPFLHMGASVSTSCVNTDLYWLLRISALLFASVQSMGLSHKVDIPVESLLFTLINYRNFLDDECSMVPSSSYFDKSNRSSI